MTCIEKFTFSRRFAVIPDPLAEDGEAAAPRPLHSDDDLACARTEAHTAGHDEGYAKGLAEGRAEAAASAQASREQRETDVLAQISAHLDRAVGERDAIAALAERSALRLALTALRKALPALHRRHASAEIEAMIRDLPEVSAEPSTVHVLVNPEFAKALEDKLRTTAAGLALGARLTIAVDSELAAGDCRIVWSGGGAERRLSALMTRINDIVATIAGQQPDEADAETPRSTDCHD